MERQLKPPPKLNIVEWADTYRKLNPKSSSTPGTWKTENVEVARLEALAGRRLDFQVGDLPVPQLEKPTDEDIEVGVCYPDGFVHIPLGTNGEWVQQLVAEQLVSEKSQRTGF